MTHKPAKTAMERVMASAASSSGATGSERATATSTREGTAKATVAEQMSQAVQSTSNLLNLMQQSSPSRNQLAKLPKDLLAKASTIKNTGQILEQLPLVISALDAHMESGLQSVAHLKTVMQLLANIESGQLNSRSHASLPVEDPELRNEPPEAG